MLLVIIVIHGSGSHTVATEPQIWAFYNFLVIISNKWFISTFCGHTASHRLSVLASLATAYKSAVQYEHAKPHDFYA